MCNVRWSSEIILNVTTFFNNNILIPRKWTLNIRNLHICHYRPSTRITFILNSFQFRNFSPYCQNKTRLESIGLRKSILGISFSPDLKMAEYKIIEIVSIDLR